MKVRWIPGFEKRYYITTDCEVYKVDENRESSKPVLLDTANCVMLHKDGIKKRYPIGILFKKAFGITIEEYRNNVHPCHSKCGMNAECKELCADWHKWEKIHRTMNEEL